MKKIDQGFQQKEVQNLVEKLKRFLGRTQLDRALSRYQRALISSGPIYSEYYLKRRHPWWQAFLDYDALVKSGKSVYKNLTDSIFFLAGDAKKISTLQVRMPESVRLKYQRDFLDDERASDFLFEISIAWHFLTRSHKIVWYEEDNRPEFSVVTNDFGFDVECKAIGVDSFRKIRRGDFYNLVDILLPSVEKMGLSGEIDLLLEERLPTNRIELRNLADQALHLIERGVRTGNHSISFGTMTFDLTEADKTIVDLRQMYAELWARKSPEAYGAIYAADSAGSPVDAIQMTCRSIKADKVLEGIRKKISDACSRQLDPSRPSLLACFIHEIEDFRGLEYGSGLEQMTNSLFLSEARNHLAAVTYSSDSRFAPTHYGREASSPAVIFRNPYCKFENVAQFRFLSKEEST
jgi:hypothetical protein